MQLLSCFERLEYKAEDSVLKICKGKHFELAVDVSFSPVSIDLPCKTIVLHFADYAKKISTKSVHWKSCQRELITRKLFAHSYILYSSGKWCMSEMIGYTAYNRLDHDNYGCN